MYITQWILNDDSFEKKQVKFCISCRNIDKNETCQLLDFVKNNGSWGTNVYISHINLNPVSCHWGPTEDEVFSNEQALYVLGAKNAVAIFMKKYWTYRYRYRILYYLVMRKSYVGLS